MEGTSTVAELEWVMRGKGCAVSKCGRYQMSISQRSNAWRFLVFSRTGEANDPWSCIGQHVGDRSGAKAIAQRHLEALT